MSPQTGTGGLHGHGLALAGACRWAVKAPPPEEPQYEPGRCAAAGLTSARAAAGVANRARFRRRGALTRRAVPSPPQPGWHPPAARWPPACATRCADEDERGRTGQFLLWRPRCPCRCCRRTRCPPPPGPAMAADRTAGCSNPVIDLRHRHLNSPRSNSRDGRQRITETGCQLLLISAAHRDGMMSGWS